MAKEISTQITISASPEKVWKILADFNSYPIWNSFIIEISGKMKKGCRLNVKLKPPGKKHMTFTPKVLVCKVEKEFCWLGHLIIPGIFDGEHQFTIIDNGNGTTTFIQREKFKGILVPLLKKMINGATKQGFEEMNQKLKERVEQEE